MGKVILDLLSPLDICELEGNARQKINFIVLYLLAFMHSLEFQAHVSADSSNMLIISHVFVHLMKGFSFRFQPYIQQNRIFGLEFFAEAIEEPVMRRKFSTIFVLDTKIQIHISEIFSLSLFIQLSLEKLSSRVYIILCICRFHMQKVFIVILVVHIPC